jgi:hypothetical protein
MQCILVREPRTGNTNRMSLKVRPMMQYAVLATPGCWKALCSALPLVCLADRPVSVSLYDCLAARGDRCWSLTMESAP